MNSVLKQGWHRLASPTVTAMVKNVMWVASGLESAKTPLFNGSKDKTLRTGHTCYAHLVGTLSVAIAPALVEGGHAKLSDEHGLIMDEPVSGNIATQH